LKPPTSSGTPNPDGGGLGVRDRQALTGTHFMTGDEASAEGALAAGCRFFAGYPITPATEVAERMAARLPQVGGVYIQMEDEIGSMAALVGASCAGARAMTSTSGPGFSLMMENIGLAAMLEAPCVIVNIMRGGPSTGLPTLTGQQDVMQARWGSHGDYEIIALSPSSPQEAFDLTVEAFNLEAPAEDFMPFYPGDDDVPPMVHAGDGYRIHATGLTHDEYGYPVIDADAQERLVQRLVRKIRDHADEIVRTEETRVDDAEVVIVSFGCSARTATEVVEIARANGLKAGLLRLITLWPFPETRIRELARSGRVKTFVVAEINAGQMVYEVERCAEGRAGVALAGLMGGRIMEPPELYEIVRKQT